ncbi:aminotransferase class I/II-fold pyridoxal phosphate-dependent enzyme [Romboutsia weinsteinii]|uniref:Aminotransferase class I/II-fold pyridoxal phosphate-dependent enzyme n=1 Tax=Romboutsia weinsteinii TaxID=2020949 RepID=A0A371IY03_9FIRM|nr:aminotransferase class I/II-fold pyridoxal phosphate-dependent enzyme [Romboutsia weinsteinii]RDY25367.1 aminotransferase class I/II-fold pyridoxal phosphate-dependent enzyme [Romboutsia weinsteinii]
MENLVINKIKQLVDENLISFHVPGHKLGKIYDSLGYGDIVKNIYKMDTTEIPGTDNLLSPEDIIKDSQINASKVFKSKSTYYLVNGSTCGIQSAIMSVCDPKDKLIVNRDCHQSVINGCILGDIDPIYIKPQINKDINVVQGIRTEDAIEIIDSNVDSKAILLTYPTYYGMTYDLKSICKYAHSKDIVVIVDEAHGAHLGLSNKLPKTALEEGADIVIQSTHKTLPAFTQSSMIHVQGDRIDENRLLSILRIVESSSPSYMLISSLELATDIYNKYGRDLMDKVLMNIENLKLKFKNNKYIEIYDTDDKTKIFISLKNIGIGGYELEDILREEYNIQVELSNPYGVLLISTIGNDKEDFISLETALDDITNRYKGNKIYEDIKYPINIPTKVLTPREAFYKVKKSVKIYESIGKICGEYIIPYPPGISLLSPGEIITEEIIDYIRMCHKKGMNVNGIKDSNLEFIQIIDSIN